MMKTGAVMLYVEDFDTALEARLDAMGATETRDRGTYSVLSDPEGNRLQVYQFAG